MKKIALYISALFAAVALVSAPVYATSPNAADNATGGVNATGNDLFDESCKGSGGSVLCRPTNSLFGPNSFFTSIVNAFIYVIGAVAVLMIVIGGFRYVVSGGDQGSITSAKNTILYAVIGLVVAILAYTIVNFVVSSF